ncbi:MAG: STAS domain-containing protein [Cyclobacteriaceae bacterium]
MININSEKKESHQLIKVIGEVDASTSIELDNALKAAAEVGSDILMDLQSLEYISSAGLGVFISYLDEFKSRDIKLVIFGLNAKVLEVFEILGLQHLMTITSDFETAIDKIK